MSVFFPVFPSRAAAASTPPPHPPPAPTPQNPRLPSFVFHYVVEKGITYLCLGDEKNKRRIPFLYLDDIKAKFQAAYGDRANTAIAFAMNSEFSRVLEERIGYFNDNPSADSFGKVKGQLEDVKGLMFDNIEKVRRRKGVGGGAVLAAREGGWGEGGALGLARWQHGPKEVLRRAVLRVSAGLTGSPPPLPPRARARCVLRPSTPYAALPRARSPAPLPRPSPPHRCSRAARRSSCWWTRPRR